MADGAYRRSGVTPAPDAARVAGIEADWDDDRIDAFAEPVRAAMIDRMERALATVRTGDLTEAAAQLTHARSVLEALGPEALAPRRGLAGLFDSRGGRLKRFRAAYQRDAVGLGAAADDLSGRIDAAAHRSAALDAVWADIRDAVVELDAHLAVAARRLSDAVPAADGSPHPLAARHAVLDACREAGLRVLPLIRVAQNIDAHAARPLHSCIDGVTAWREDWTHILGLAGRRPKKVRPDPISLARTRDDLLARIDRGLADLAASQDRRADAVSRIADLRRPL